MAQPLDEPLYNYGDYKGNYYIRTKIHFVETTTNQWLGNFTGAQLQQRADGIMENLNREYNKHRIYFLSADGKCAEGAAYDTISHQGTTYDAADLDGEVIDIFDHGNAPGGLCAPPNNTLCGKAGGTPSRFCELWGSYSAGGMVVPTGHTPVAIHEMGHALGLLHTHNGLDGNGCDEMNDPCPSGAPSNLLPCECCGDNVCDTDPTPPLLDFGTDCTHPFLSNAQIRNYMNGATPNASILCQDTFSPGQVKRLRAYLEKSSEDFLSPVLVKGATPYAGTLPAGTYFNIVVETGTTLNIYSPIEMLPGTWIKVEKGARLNVYSTITGACGQMWQGVVVEGDTGYPQNAQNQGWVVMNSNGKIEHARCGISLHDIDEDGNPMPGTGGGYAWIYGGDFENNLIGVRFGPYHYPANLNATTIAGSFSVTDDLRDDTQTPVFIEASDNARLRVQSSSFRDLRTSCSISFANESDRAWGIILLNAGMGIVNCTFENLETGIWADFISVSKGSFLLKSNQFDNCYTSVLSHNTSSFSIRDNDFFIKKPEDCPDSERMITGIHLEGETSGFTLMNNNLFSDDINSSDTETLTGINVSEIEEGMDNVIFKNKFTYLDIGNRAEGKNADDEDGLLYLCNTNIDCTDDFIVTASGTIQEEQKDENPMTFDDWPTGNIFSNLVNSFMNFGSVTVKYFYTNDPDQTPTGDTSGITLNFINESNGNCAELPPCPPPCDHAESVEAWKQEFHRDRQEWVSRTADLSNLTDSLQILAAKDTISRYRASMNKNASLVLQQFSLDTVTVLETDSIVHWLTLAESYPADLRLTRHYFFSQELAAFDTLWSQMPSKHGLADARLDKFNELGYVYDLVRPHVQTGKPLSSLSESTLDSLKFWSDWCSEPGFLAQSLLFRNGIFVRPDCSAGPGERSSEEAGDEAPPAAPAAFKVWPNPAGQTLNIKSVHAFEDGMLRLLDFQGRTVLLHRMPLDSYQHTLDLGGISPGIYFLQIQPFQGKSEQVKVIVSR